MSTALNDFEEVLDLLGDDFKGDFQELHKELEVLEAQQRKSLKGRAAAENFTPAALKELVPGHNRIPRVYLVHQRTAQECCAYYGGGPHGSAGRSWGGLELS